MTPQAHDLLWIGDTAALESDAPLPDWVVDGWSLRAPVVVRREATDRMRIPVGLRGLRRDQRHRAYLPAAAVRRRVRPEDLSAAQPWRQPWPFGRFAALTALAELAPLLDDAGLPWGPTGGVGFALACGLPALRPDSDLDLVVRAPQPLTARLQAGLARLCRPRGCRIDLQIDTGRGAFAFIEWQAGRRMVLVKTDQGPVLAGDPWYPPVS